MGFGCVLGSFRVFMPCMVQQMLYIGNAWRGKTPRTWHFWNIKIPKPPCISSLKIIGLLHFSKLFGTTEEIYSLFWSPCSSFLESDQLLCIAQCASGEILVKRPTLRQKAEMLTKWISRFSDLANWSERVSSGLMWGRRSFALSAKHLWQRHRIGFVCWFCSSNSDLVTTSDISWFVINFRYLLDQVWEVVQVCSDAVSKSSSKAAAYFEFRPRDTVAASEVSWFKRMVLHDFAHHFSRKYFCVGSILNIARIANAVQCHS